MMHGHKNLKPLYIFDHIYSYIYILYIYIYTQLYAKYLAQFFVVFREKVVEKIKTHFLCPVTFFS